MRHVSKYLLLASGLILVFLGALLMFTASILAIFLLFFGASGYFDSLNSFATFLFLVALAFTLFAMLIFGQKIIRKSRNFTSIVDEDAISVAIYNFPIVRFSIFVSATLSSAAITYFLFEFRSLQTVLIYTFLILLLFWFFFFAPNSPVGSVSSDEERTKRKLLGRRMFMIMTATVGASALISTVFYSIQSRRERKEKQKLQAKLDLDRNQKAHSNASTYGPMLRRSVYQFDPKLHKFIRVQTFSQKKCMPKSGPSEALEWDC